MLLGSAAGAARAQQAPSPPPSPVIARVDGRPITEEEFDRVAAPYFDRLRAEMKQGFNDQVEGLAKQNVLEELIRRQLLAIEAQREKLVVTDAETDQFLRQDPFFYTNGKFDQAKFIQYKITPGSNYLAVLPKIRELVRVSKMDSLARRRSRPTAAAVREEWEKRNDQVKFAFFALGSNDVSLDPEATPAERAAYYATHPDQFETGPRIRFRYLRLPLPPEGDSLRVREQAAALQRGRRWADSLRAGTPLDSLKAPAGAVDSGMLAVPVAAVPGLGPAPELTAELDRADTDTTVAVVGPAITPDAVVVGRVVERQPRRLPPLEEVVADVRRRADAEKRNAALESEQRAYYQVHQDAYRTARARVVRVVLPDSAVAVKPPSQRDQERWYAKQGATLFAPDSAGALPALDDSLRGVVAARLIAEQRAQRAARVLAGIASDWKAGRVLRPDARRAGAAVESLAYHRGSPGDAVFPASFVDSLLRGEGSPVGVVAGPRGFAGGTALWRVEALDTAYVPPFDSVRARVETAVQEQRRAADEAEARSYFDAHRDEFKTPPRFVVDYVKVAIPPPDSVKVPEPEQRAYYQSHLDRYRKQEEVHARHILIGTGPGQTPGGEAAARARADSLFGAIRGGADFATLARSFSQDPGSASAGGDLGFFPRGRMVQEFSDTAFALAPGQVSHPVKTRFGYHLIQVVERRPAGITPFEEARVEIARELGRSRGDSTALRQADALRRRLARGGVAAQRAAAAAGLATSPPFAANQPVPGVGFVAGLGRDLDNLPVGRWAPQAYRADNGYLLVRCARRIPPAPAEFAEAKSEAISRMKAAKKRALLDQRVAELRQALAAGASLDSLAAPYGGLKDAGFVARAAGFVPYLGREPRVIAAAFAAKPGMVSDTVATTQGVVWLKVEQKQTREGASFAKDRQAIEQELATTRYDEWLKQRREAARIEILRADLREKPQPIQQSFTIPAGGGR